MTSSPFVVVTLCPQLTTSFSYVVFPVITSFLVNSVNPFHQSEDIFREGFVAPIFELPLFSLLPLFSFPLLPVEAGLLASGVISILTIGASATAFTSIVVV
jgi:hypothetical protein